MDQRELKELREKLKKADLLDNRIKDLSNKLNVIHNTPLDSITIGANDLQVRRVAIFDLPPTLKLINFLKEAIRTEIKTLQAKMDEL